ncbi:MAG: aminoglycoside phosphotransferase family protein [Chloroflexota bacterium]
MSSPLSLPSEFAQRILGVYPAGGRAWLRDLPALLDEIAARWTLTAGPPLERLSYNYVTAATLADGGLAILKLGVPNPELTSEIATLAFYGGRGAARLLAADADRGALLMERLIPGQRLADTLAHADDASDIRATEIAMAVMRALWRPTPAPPEEPGPYLTVERWGRGFARMRQRFGGGSGPIPAHLADRAERLYTELAGSQGERVLLHGDLHHENILSAGRAPWLAIDPKGVIGERAYEVGALLRNPWPRLLRWADLARTQRRRLNQLAEGLGLDRQRLLGWAIAQAVLSAWWCIEDSAGDVDRWVALAEVFAALG